MRITVINGTEKKGVSYKLKEAFLAQFGDSSEITEFYLPRDCPGFCSGCMTCFLKDQNKCKDARYVQQIEKAMLGADLLVFTTPAYVFHVTGAMKAFLDHLGYRWIPHRPAKEMFGKRAVIITQCLGAGGRSAAKDIKDSLSWWGVSYIKTCSFKLMSEVNWDKIPEKKRTKMISVINSTAGKLKAVDYSKKARTNLITKIKFYAVRMMQTGLGKDDPDYTDYKYWAANGWIGRERPWR